MELLSEFLADFDMTGQCFGDYFLPQIFQTFWTRNEHFERRTEGGRRTAGRNDTEIWEFDLQDGVWILFMWCGVVFTNMRTRFFF